MSSTSQCAMSELKTGCSRAPKALAGENAKDMVRSSASQPKKKRGTNRSRSSVLDVDAQVAELVEVVGRHADRRNATCRLSRRSVDRIPAASRRTCASAARTGPSRRGRGRGSPCSASRLRFSQCSTMSTSRRAGPADAALEEGDVELGEAPGHPAEEQRLAQPVHPLGEEADVVEDVAADRGEGVRRDVADAAVEDGGEAAVAQRGPHRVVVVGAVEAEGVEPVRLSRQQERRGEIRVGLRDRAGSRPRGGRRP